MTVTATAIFLEVVSRVRLRVCRELVSLGHE